MAIKQLVYGQQLSETMHAPRRTQAQRREESENRLLAAAAEIIAEEGYLACTLERVGERAGFSRGLASRKYGSKDGLIEAVIWKVSADVHGQIETAIAGIESPLERLLVLLDQFVELVLREVSVRAYFVLFSAMIANRLDVRAVFQEVQDRFAQRLEAMIRAAQEAGEVPPARSPQTTAFVLGSLLAGMAVEVAMGNGEAAQATRPDMQAMMRAALAG